MNKSPHIVIIGAGIVGAAIGHAIGRQARVTILDPHFPGAGASSKGFGWINASFAETPEYHALRRAAIDAHRALGPLAEPVTRWGGALWWEADGPAFDAHAARLSALGYPVEIVDRRAITAREPHLANPPARALLTPLEGATDAAALAQRLIHASGATLRLGTHARHLIARQGRITGVATSHGPIAADAVIIAAGVASPALLAPFGLALPVSANPGLILHTAPVARLLNHLILAPDIHFRQDAAGRLIAGEIFSGDGPGADRITEDPQGLAAEILTRLRARLPGHDIRLETLMLGHRPLPADGMPLVGPVPGLAGAYLAVMHSGVTLAPIIGQLLATEVIGQCESPLLAPFRPARLL